MQFNIITIFPKIFDSYFNESMIRRARAKKLADIRVYDLRTFSRDKHKKVDDRPYGGGPGMVLKVDPLARALDSILKKSDKKTKVILFAAGGKQFDAKMAHEFAQKYDRIVMIAGHYEGVDVRIKKLFHVEEISIGPYVLTGGEIPAMVVTDAVLRHTPGFLGKRESLEENRYGIGVPMYTRPELFEWKGKKYRVPKILLSGAHKEIEEWRKKKRSTSEK